MFHKCDALNSNTFQFYVVIDKTTYAHPGALVTQTAEVLGFKIHTCPSVNDKVLSPLISRVPSRLLYILL